MRVANRKEYSPNNVQLVAIQIRRILGSKESSSHFRIGGKAFEFNLFARDEDELQAQKKLLEQNGYVIESVKMLDTPPVALSRENALAQGIELFNEERFWESHEVLEQIWHHSNGIERDTIQGLILTAAAFVHYQKGETETCLSVLHRARKKLSPNASLPPLDTQALRKRIDQTLESNTVRLFKLQTYQF